LPNVTIKGPTRHTITTARVLRDDFRTCPTRFARARRTREFRVIPKTTLASASFFPTSWYVAVTFIRAVADDSTVFCLKLFEPRFPLGIAGESQSFVRTISTIRNRLESGALAQERDGIVVPIEFENAGASDDK
jgi:hypothetical protein